LFVKEVADDVMARVVGRSTGARRGRIVDAGPGVAVAEEPVVRTLDRSRRLVESFPGMPSRAR
jgi:hypothetical protein